MSIQKITRDPSKRYIFVSDLHLGSKFLNTDRLLKFFSTHATPDTVFVFLGDVYDVWKISPAQFTIAELVGPADFIFIPGNHDAEFNFLLGASHNFPLGDVLQIDDLLALHGHQFDISFGNPFSVWTRLKDYGLYLISKLLNVDFRHSFSWARKLKELYYMWIQHESDVVSFCKSNAGNAIVIGHTHSVGEESYNGISVYHLGTWLHRPGVLFIEKTGCRHFQQIS